MKRVRAEASEARDERVRERVRRLSSLLDRPHAMEEVEAEVAALNEIVRSFQTTAAPPRQSLDAVAEARRPVRKRTVRQANEEPATPLPLSRELRRKSLALSGRERPAARDAAAGEMGNRILARLSDAELDALRPELEQVSLALGDVLYQDGQEPHYVYFPEGAVITLLTMMENGSMAGVGLVGSEGLVGIRVLAGGATVPCHPVVQRAGTAWRMKADSFREHLGRGGALAPLLLTYAQSVITQVRQLAACNQFHSLDRKLVRWLLMLHDRAESNHILLTQDLMANLIGARRAGVSIAASLLQERGLIRYRRGLITILDRCALEESACECYAAFRHA